MGATLAAATSAPLMAILMIFEMTLSYSLLLPLMLACVVAYGVARAVNGPSMYEITARRAADEHERERLRAIRMQELIRPVDTVLPLDAPIAQDAAPQSAAVAAGEQVFKKCRACHSLEPGKNLLGPSLAGIIGRHAGTEAGYDYSAAMKSAAIVWDATTLDQYLAAPQKFVPGNKMPFPGLKTADNRRTLIAFLTAERGPGAPATAAKPATATAAAKPSASAAPAAPPSSTPPQAAA